MEKTWKPVVAGILDIVAGTLGGILSFMVILGILVFTLVSRSDWLGIPMEASEFIPIIIGVLAIPVLAISILSIIGGVFALNRRIWGLALTGSIAALFVSTVLGIPAIVFIVLSKNEFNNR